MDSHRRGARPMDTFGGAIGVVRPASANADPPQTLRAPGGEAYRLVTTT
jgi:hypothetical protein